MLKNNQINLDKNKNKLKKGSVQVKKLHLSNFIKYNQSLLFLNALENQ